MIRSDISCLTFPFVDLLLYSQTSFNITWCTLHSGFIPVTDTHTSSFTYTLSTFSILQILSLPKRTSNSYLHISFRSLQSSVPLTLLLWLLLVFLFLKSFRSKLLSLKWNSTTTVDLCRVTSIKRSPKFYVLISNSHSNPGPYI